MRHRLRQMIPYILITILCVLLALAVVTASDGALHTILLPPALGD